MDGETVRVACDATLTCGMNTKISEENHCVCAFDADVVSVTESYCMSQLGCLV